MRTHGEPGWPDPNSQGGFDFHGTSGVDFNSSTYTSATKACQHLLPNGGQVTQAQLQQGLTAALKYAQCMRTHGLPTFPDPTMSAGGSGISMGPPSGISPNSPQLQAAQKACRSLQPGGDGGG